MDYQRHYSALVSRGRERNLQCYTENHHILPRCMGGTDDAINLVKLTPEEHYVAHQLLVKMHPNEPKLIFAALMMSVNNGKNGRNNNKSYGWLRKLRSTIMTGKTSPKKGTKTPDCVKQKQSIAAQNRKVTDETREKHRLNMLIRHAEGKGIKNHTVLTKKKISDANKKRILNGYIHPNLKDWDDLSYFIQCRLYRANSNRVPIGWLPKNKEKQKCQQQYANC